MTLPPTAFPSALRSIVSPARRSEAILCWFLILITLVLLVAACRAGVVAGLDGYIGPHAGGQFLNGVCVVATKWLTGVGNYVCLGDVSASMTGLGLAPSGPTWPGFLADRGFLDEALRLLFGRPHWAVPVTTTGPPYDGIMGIGWGMDNGYADFVNLSFRIFGPAIKSLYRGYWLVCFVSYLLFIIVYWRRVVPLVLLAATAVVQYFIFSSDIFWSAGQEWAASENARVHGPTGPRFLSSICVVPALHYLCATWKNEPLHWREAVLLGLQGIIICLALQQRTTVYWVVAAALLLAALHRVFLNQHTDAVTKRRRTLILVELLTVVVLCKAGVAITTHPGLNARGFMTSHTLWGSVFYSMQFHPDWKSRYSAEFGHNEGDGVADFAWKRYVANHPKEQGKEITHAFIETMIRKAMVEFAMRDPKFVLEIYLFNNPRIIYEAATTVITSMAKGVPVLVPILLIAFGLVLGVVSSRVDLYLLVASLPLITVVCLVSSLPNWATLPTSSSLTDFYLLLLITCVMYVVALGAAGGCILRRSLEKANQDQGEPCCN